MTWTVLTSRYVLQDDWIRVRAECCVTKAGHRINPYYTLEYPDFVHVFALTQGKNLILTRQYRHGFGDIILELPGGMIDPADKSPSEAGLRELCEETGYRLTDYTMLPSLTNDPAKLTNRTHLLVGTGAWEVEETSFANPSEEIEVVQMSVPEVLTAIQDGRFPNACHIGMVFLGLSHLKLAGIDPAHG